MKCNPEITSAAFKSNLKYINADSSSYDIRYDLQSDIGWNDLVALCDSLTNIPYHSVLWLMSTGSYGCLHSIMYWWTSTVTVEHLPKTIIHIKTTRDISIRLYGLLNMAFGGFAFAGSQGVGLGTLDTAGMRTLSPLLHSTESDWPLIVNVLNNPMYKKMYIADAYNRGWNVCPGELFFHCHATSGDRQLDFSSEWCERFFQLFPVSEWLDWSCYCKQQGGSRHQHTDRMQEQLTFILLLNSCSFHR